MKALLPLAVVCLLANATGQITSASNEGCYCNIHCYEYCYDLSVYSENKVDATTCRYAEASVKIECDRANAQRPWYSSYSRGRCSASCHPCFPGDAVVTLDNGNKKTMADLAVGDKVLTANGVYTEVFLFSHRLQSASYNFIEFKTETTTLAVTGNHYLYVNGNLREAQYVSVGDSLTLASGKLAKVLSVGRVQKDGIFNPHTLQGDIVVDGVLTSTYTSAFSPTLAHVVLAPLRGLYMAGVDIFKLDIGNALDQLPAWWKTMYAA